VPEPLTLTVDATTRRRMVTDLWLHDVRTLRGRRLLSYLAAGWVVLLVWHDVVGTLAVVALLILGRVAWWWVRLTRRMAKRLPTGQVVSVGHTEGGDLVIRDTDEVWLPRGSALTVERIGSVTIAHGRTVSAVVPTVLLSDEDAAFLEGHGTQAPAQTATDEPPDLPLSVEITEQIQDDLVRARRQSYLWSGEFGITLVTPLLLFALMVAIAEPRTTLIAVLVVSIPVALGLNTTRTSCGGLRRLFPVGHVLRAGADEDGLVLTMVHGTPRLRWSEFQAHRLRERTLELRTRKGRALRNVTLPRDLFTPMSLQLLTLAVPRSFGGGTTG
jgi:hypothetical protein